MSIGIALAERGLLPDWTLRRGIRHYTGQRLRQSVSGTAKDRRDRRLAFIDALNNSPIAISTHEANDQHYEVPPDFYRICLGDNLKYSCAWYDSPSDSLAKAEEAMFEHYVERAGLRDGMALMDLGCGWGSLTLWLAQRFPNMQITSLSNSRGQKAHIDGVAYERGLKNIQVITANINDYQAEHQFDRVISIEMFEHMRNYGALMEKIAGWLKDDGHLFVHIFCHQTDGYLYEIDGEGDWMARNFFTGGVMPSLDLLPSFDQHLVCADRWWVNGKHYAYTARDWLSNLDRRKTDALSVLDRDLSPHEARIQFNRWRMFFLTCEEFFAWNNGEEWGVCHYLFRKR